MKPKKSVNDLRGHAPEELLRLRDRVQQEMRQISDAAAGRELDADEQSRFDELEGQLGEIQERLDRDAKLAAYLRDHPNARVSPFNVTRGAFRDVDPEEALRMSSDQVRDSALAILEAEGKHLEPRDQDRIESMVRSRLGPENRNLDGDYVARRIAITESPQYRSAFQQLMTQDRPLLSNEEILAVRSLRELEARAMSENIAAGGGVGVSAFIDPTILLSAQVESAPLLDFARVEPVTTNVWKGVSSAGVTWAFGTESTEVADSSPTLAQPSVTVHMATGFIPYTIEVESDYPGFAEQMAEILAGGYVDLIASKLINGSGTNEPKGIVVALDATAASEVLLTTAGQFSASDLFKCWNALPERFRGRAAWLMSVGVESSIRSFSTPNSPSAYFTVDLTAGGLTRLNGRPTGVTDYMPAALSTTGHANVLVVGSFRDAYLVAQRAGMWVERVAHLFGSTNHRPTGQRGMFAWARTGADVIVPQAARVLNQT